MNNIKLLGILFAFVLLLSACQPIERTETPPVEQTETPPSADGEYSSGQAAIVESLEVFLLESFPLQARVRVSGNLPDGCTELVEISVEQQGQEFILTLTTRRPTGDVACTQVLVPFEEMVDLDIQGLDAGTYAVIAQEEQATFTLDVDNVIPEEGGEQPEFEYGSNATVEAMSVIMEFDPVQVSVVLEGYLPDGCTEIEKITAIRDNRNFLIEITTRRPSGDVMCTQQIVPFEETINLDVENLEVGEYTVIYGEMSGSFTLE